MHTGIVSEGRLGGVLAMPVRRESGQKSRGDHLPEYTKYRDDGCDISASCFDCPLPRCRYEEPGGLRALLNESRDREIVQLRLKGMPVEQLADRFGVSRRTVFRIIGTRHIPARPRDYDTTPIPISSKQNVPFTRKEALSA